MSAAHTPGPWAVVFEKTATGKEFGLIVGGSGKTGLMNVVICHAPDSQAEPISFAKFQEANAHILAASIDTLKALTDLVANQDANWVAAGFTDEQIKAMPYLMPARAAIAKVGGAA